MSQTTYPVSVTLTTPCAKCKASDGYQDIVGGFVYTYCRQSHQQPGCVGKVGRLAAEAVDHRCEVGKQIAKAARRMGIETR